MHAVTTLLWESACADLMLQNNTRTYAIRAVAKANKLDIEYIDFTPIKDTAEYIKLSPLKLVPVFEGSDGYVVTEAIAVAVYSESSPRINTPLARCAGVASVMRSFNFSYPCLKSTVETYSHSDDTTVRPVISLQPSWIASLTRYSHVAE